MTRKDYRLIAAAIKNSKPEVHWDPNKMAQWVVTVNRVTDALASDNAAFKPTLFLNACGVDR